MGFDRIGFAESDGEEAALGRITVAGVLDDLMRIGTLEDCDRDMEDLWWGVGMYAALLGLRGEVIGFRQR